MLLRFYYTEVKFLIIQPEIEQILKLLYYTGIYAVGTNWFSSILLNTKISALQR